MKICLVMVTARSAVIEIADGGRYFTKDTYTLTINGKLYGETNVVINNLYDLTPDTEYVVDVRNGESVVDQIAFRTEYEYVTLDVRKFGAKGDGVNDDTNFIQAAIMACPENSRVLIPAGVYRITSLFLKSHLRLELAEGAELKAFHERERFPIMPPSFKSNDGTDEYFLGTWEGEPQPMFASIISGYFVEDVIIYGKGTVNGNSTKESWWQNPKVMQTAYRPRLFHINHCRNVSLHGISICNSPSWTIHPFFSENLKFVGLDIQNPEDSPNTDGINPESCKNVEIIGVHISVGDDCIAVKSGKLYMGRRFKQPTEDVMIRQCFMEKGHGAVVLGSEIGGGVKRLMVKDCFFKNTDRGLRIKTRRGRGKDCVVSDIVFKDLTLDHVMTPLVVNEFYFCDPDGKTEYVQSRDCYPVDDRTPIIKRMVFENMMCTNCHVAAAFFDGLPEQKIEELELRNISITYAEDSKKDLPAMSVGIEACSRKGIFARNVTKLVLENVSIEGQLGDALELVGVDKLVEMQAE